MKSDHLTKVYQNSHKHPKIPLDGLNSLRTHYPSNIIILHLKITQLETSLMILN